MTPRDRKAASELWLRVVQGKSNWDTALETTPAFLRLDGRDRAFAYRLAAATLRHYNAIALILKNLTSRSQIKPVELEALLHLGLCQILFLDTAPHAAVNSTVELASEKYKGFINAVLRRALREKDQILAEYNIARIAAPEWLWRQLTKDWGDAEAEAIIGFCLQEPAIDLTLKKPSESGSWAVTLNAGVHPFGSLRLHESGTVSAMPGYTEGEWWVQDAAASLPAQMAGSDLNGLKVIDLCAAPGGKTLQLAAAGAQVTAVDLDPDRLRRVVENAARCGLSDRITPICGDAREVGELGAYDVVLLDAPCSASGTLRRHPDMWTQQKERNIKEFVDIQQALLARAAQLVRPDGKIIYATCSLDKREGEAQKEWFLESHKRFNIYTNNNVSPYGRIFPHQSQTDGFFFCAFEGHS